MKNSRQPEPRPEGYGAGEPGPVTINSTGEPPIPQSLISTRTLVTIYRAQSRWNIGIRYLTYRLVDVGGAGVAYQNDLGDTTLAVGVLGKGHIYRNPGMTGGVTADFEKEGCDAG